MKTEFRYRKDLVEIGKRIHQKGWISSTDGNFSVKLGDDKILTTPTGIHKGFMEEDDLIVTDMTGKKISGTRNPSSEIALHIACYKQRPDVSAVIHAHPTLCVAFSLAGIPLAQCLLPEVVFTLGSIPTADYAVPTTDEVPKSIEKSIREYDAVILERHGSVTVGKTIFDAYNTLERMEHVAEITYHARALGNPRPLTKTQVDELLKIRSGLGLPERKVTCNDCNSCGKHNCAHSATTKPDDGTLSVVQAREKDEPLIELITREVMAELKKFS
jgi:L-fuculose-phosphate aldolase